MSGADESAGFVLHARRFRENSRILELFTREHGRVAVVARVSARPGRQGAAQLQPFRELLLRWRGRRALKNLQSFEALTLIALDGEAGICGLYCNELLLRLLPEQEPLPAIYDIYRRTLAALHDGAEPAPVLRRFEWRLLDELGYAADTEEDCLTGGPLAQADEYHFQPGQGFSVKLIGRDAVRLDAETMRALQRGEFDDPRLQRGLRRVTAAALQPLLGPKELKSRKLMRQLLQMKGKERNDSAHP